MKKLLISILQAIAIIAVSLTVLEASPETEQWARNIASLNSDEVLTRIQSAGDTWPKLSALSLASDEERPSISQITITTLQALAKEARALPDIQNEKMLFDRTIRASDIGQEVASKGGYLNELIAASADRVFLEGSWFILDRFPSQAAKLKKIIDSRRKLQSPKEWFSQRYTLDATLASKQEAIKSMKVDATGFQAAMAVKSQGNDVNNLPSVFVQITNPDIASLWWEVYIMDFRVNAVLRSAIAFIEKGGNLKPEPINKSAAIESIFGSDGSPYHHELRRGAIRSDDIWTEQKANLEQKMRELNLDQWFGPK